MAKILIVEDSVTIRRLIRSIIEKSSEHTVVGEASNGAEAITKYGKLKPDLVTMDIAMPEMNGIVALKKLLAQYPEAKVLMVSSLSKKESVILSLKSGAKGYILKPVNENKFLTTIDSILEDE